MPLLPQMLLPADRCGDGAVEYWRAYTASVIFLTEEEPTGVDLPGSCPGRSDARAP